MSLTHGALFAGIGGFDLGFERAGIETNWQVEIDEHCRRVLAARFPSSVQYADIRRCESLPYVDVISGGFPCQDVSKAGNRAGITPTTRSGLWFEMLRTIRMVRPRIATVENVAALLERGISTVLGDLAESGYDAEWDCLPASAFGAPHLRDRTFIVAYPDSERPIYGETGRLAAEAGLQTFGDPGASGTAGELRGETEGQGWPFGDFEWVREPEIRRVVDGLPGGLDKADIKCFGNAIIPQATEWVGNQIMKALGEVKE